MIKLKKIADNLGYITNDIKTEFDDTKDIFFRAENGIYYALLKLDKTRSIFFSFFDERAVMEGSMETSDELKNGKLDGCSIKWIDEPNYYEYKNGIAEGYHEYANQEKLSARGFYKNGKREGWWEFGDKYDDIAYGREDFFELKDYRPARMVFYNQGLDLGDFYPTDSVYEYERATSLEYGPLTQTYDNYRDHPETFDHLKKHLIRYIKEEVEKGGIYRGDRASYISYTTYLKVTNLSKLKPPDHPHSYGGHANSINYWELESKYWKIIDKKVSIKNFKIDNINFE
jgi:hypothetical protein